MDHLVTLRWPDPTLAVVGMEDRVSKNRSSPAFIAGIESAFREIARRQETRAVVIHGYDNYFCCGGSREELLLLASREAVFTDLPFYDQLLRCELPVVAAMGGHAIGGGLVFGAYADVLVLAEESLYSANFLHYGFTPGMGATWVIPKKFGFTLGWEMLFTARNYQGGELRARGAPVRFARKAGVLDAALAVAREIADKPAFALRELKRCYYASIRDELAAAVRKELAMHDATFARPEVHARIRSLYPD